MKTLINIVAYLFSNAKFSNAKSGQFERTASRRQARPVRRPATPAAKVEQQRTILVNWPDGRATVMVL
jgi:hypothetical protein